MLKLPNFAMRIAVRGVMKYDHPRISALFKEPQQLTIKQKHRFEVGTTVFKAFPGFYPDWL